MPLILMCSAKLRGLSLVAFPESGIQVRGWRLQRRDLVKTFSSDSQLSGGGLPSLALLVAESRWFHWQQDGGGGGSSSSDSCMTRPPTSLSGHHVLGICRPT